MINPYRLLPKSFGRPVAWQPEKAPKLTGTYATNQRLANARPFLSLPGTSGPESLAVDAQGRFYSGFADGRIARFLPDGSLDQVLINTGGRPLGMRVHPSGSLIVCDAVRGLLQVTFGQKKRWFHRAQPWVTLKVLSDKAGRVPFKFCDDCDISADGRYVYFSDASSQRGEAGMQLDLLEHGGYGRLLCYDMKTTKTRVLMSGLNFANGVQIAADGQSVLVTETGGYAIHRFWLSGSKAGKSELFASNLPGMPDNIRHAGGTYYVAMPAPRSKLLDGLADKPLIRLGAMQALKLIDIPVAELSMVLGFDEAGELTHNLQGGKYTFITQALPVGQNLYLSSLRQASVLKLEL